MFVLGQIYRRRDLHSRFGGQRQGGISTPASHNLILLFTGKQGEQYGYSDGWSHEGVFLYTGEGQRGEMELVRRNRARLDHAQRGKDVHLFAYTRQRGFVRYMGQMVCSGYHHRTAPDADGETRQAIVFELAPINESEEPSPLASSTATSDEDLAGVSIEELRAKALASSSTAGTPAERKAVVRIRSHAIKLYVLQRSQGVCEGCDQPAPFQTPRGTAYLEPHHIRRLSDGGPDHPRWVAALCPNCHRRAHYSTDATAFNQGLADMLGRIEDDGP